MYEVFIKLSSIFCGEIYEEGGFWEVIKNDFLFDNNVVKDLSISDNDLSNDIIDVILTWIIWEWWMMNDLFLFIR